MDIDAERWVDAHEFAAEMFAAQHEIDGNDAIFEDLLIMIDIKEEEVQRGDTLRLPAFEMLPFLVRDDARDHVKGEDAFDAFLRAIDGEGDALIHELDGEGLPARF